MIDFESRVQRVYEAVLRPGCGAIDVGAHVGRHAFEMMKLVTPGGHVKMYEPMPEFFAKLCTRVNNLIGADQKVEVYPYALSDSTGQTEFCVAIDAPWFSGMRERRYDSPTRVQRIEVPVRKLDDEARLMSRVDYIKIDTEGAEFYVLKGSTETMHRHRPVITFEFGLASYKVYDIDPGEVYRFFQLHSYNLYDILGKLMIDEASFSLSSVNQQLWDYIAVPIEKTDFVANL
jgi:FkbM family methyltransferase